MSRKIASAESPSDDSAELKVARFMVGELQRQGELYQEDVVADIERKFGKKFVYTNENGNPAIDKKVLKEFRSLTSESVVWVRSERLWRKRDKNDGDGRMAED